jgi:hypothetical protein
VAIYVTGFDGSRAVSGDNDISSLVQLIRSRYQRRPDAGDNKMIAAALASPASAVSICSSTSKSSNTLTMMSRIWPDERPFANIGVDIEFAKGLSEEFASSSTGAAMSSKFSSSSHTELKKENQINGAAHSATKARPGL